MGEVGRIVASREVGDEKNFHNTSCRITSPHPALIE